MIPINRIAVVNPRVRNKKVFKEIVRNIAEIGLKRPITVTRRAEAGGPYYDLVCGQGRLEAYKALGQKAVPALVVSANQEDCMVASLVENCARRQHRAVDLLHDIGGMKQRGYSVPEVAQKTGLSSEYVYAVVRLLEKGEQRLLRAVESGQIRLSTSAARASATANGRLRARQA
jgi:ParB family transcriptional regulator, chromosome partitioning protein